MKITESKTVTTEQVVETICDVCGLSVARDAAIAAEHPEATLAILPSENSVRIQHNYSSRKYEDLHYASFEPDLCPRCFVDIIVPALRNAGCQLPYKHGYL